MLGELLTDTVTLIKRDGRRIESLKASVQSDIIFIDDATIPVEEGDRIERKLPSGLKETYTVLSPGFQKGVHGIPDHYQIKVRRESALPTEEEAIDAASAELKLKTVSTMYVDPSRINELESLQRVNFDLTKLVRLCEELNICFEGECYLAITMIIRAVLDHVPPIFGFTKFSEVANNYSGSKSFKESMQNLENSSRKIADQHLHCHIRKSETLPTLRQVDFSNDLDVLLAEIVRLLK